MDDERPAGGHPLRPSVEVLCGCGLGVAAVDEQKLQGRPPPLRHNRRLAHDGDDVLVQSDGVERATKRRQRVEQSGDLVDQRGVVVFPAGLVFLGAVVMVDRVEHAGGLLRRRAEQQRGFTALCSDLDTDAAVEVPHRGIVKRAPLVVRHETPHLLGRREQALGCTGVGAAHELNLSLGLVASTGVVVFLAGQSKEVPCLDSRPTHLCCPGGAIALISCCARFSYP